MMDGRSRIATIRIGNDAEDATPAIKFNLEDHLGTSSVMVDFSGNLINREEYYPFGESCFGAFAKKRYRYVGKEKDNESGLYYYGARYYAGWMCRFISVDPLAASYAHLTPYNYAGNKPIGDFDIDGLQGTGEGTSEFPMNPTDSAGNTTSIELKAVEVTAMSNKTKAATFFAAFAITVLFAAAVIVAAPLVLPAVAQGMAAVIGAQATATVGTVAGAGLATYGAIQTGESAYAVATGKDFRTGEELSEEEYWSTAGGLAGEAVTVVPAVKAVRGAVAELPKPGKGLAPNGSEGSSTGGKNNAAMREGAAFADAPNLTSTGKPGRLALGTEIVNGDARGLDKFATSKNAVTHKAAPDKMDWKSWIQEMVLDPEVEVEVNLTGLDVWGGVSRAAGGVGSATDWELFLIRSNPQVWDRVRFWDSGRPVPNPFQ